MKPKNSSYPMVVSQASHKIGALLTVIKEGMSLVFEGKIGSINDSQKKSLFFCERAVNRLTQLVSDLIDIEHIINKNITSRKEKINVHNIIECVCKTIRQEVEAKNILLENRLPYDLPFVYVDCDKITRAIINIIEDILKFIHEGEKIYITSCEYTSVESHNFVNISVKTDTTIKILTSYRRLLLVTKDIKRLLRSDISINMIIGKALIECQGGKVKIIKDNEIILSIPNQ